MPRIDPVALREVALGRLAILFPELAVSPRGTDAFVLDLTWPDGVTAALSLENPWREIEQNHGQDVDIVAIVDRYVRAMARSAVTRRPGHLVVMVKTDAFMDAARARGITLSAQPLAGDLHVVLAWDQPDAVAFATDVVDVARSVQVASRNVMRLIEGPHVDGDGPWMLRCGGTYEASLLVCDFWPKLKEGLGIRGRMVVAVPARDVLLVADGDAPEHLAALRQSIDHAFAAGFSYLLSRCLLVWVDNAWQELV